MLKKYNIKDIIITKLKDNDYLKKQYQANYAITINKDIIDFANTLKDAKTIARNFIKEIEERD